MPTSPPTCYARDLPSVINSLTFWQIEAYGCVPIHMPASTRMSDHPARVMKTTRPFSPPAPIEMNPEVRWILGPQPTKERPRMKTKERKLYTAEFKAQAVALIATGKPVTQLAEELCVSSNLLCNWRLKSQEAQGGGAGARSRGRGLRSGRPAPPAARGRPAQARERHF